MKKRLARKGGKKKRMMKIRKKYSVYNIISFEQNLDDRVHVKGFRT